MTKLHSGTRHIMVLIRLMLTNMSPIMMMRPMMMMTVRLMFTDVQGLNLFGGQDHNVLFTFCTFVASAR